MTNAIQIILAAILALLRNVARAYIRNAPFSVPFTAGAIGGWMLGRVALAHGIPYRWLPLAWAIIMGAGVGRLGKEWWSDVFGKKG